MSVIKREGSLRFEFVVHIAGKKSEFYGISTVFGKR